MPRLLSNVPDALRPGVPAPAEFTAERAKYFADAPPAPMDSVPVEPKPAG